MASESRSYVSVLLLLVRFVRVVYWSSRFVRQRFDRGAVPRIADKEGDTRDVLVSMVISVPILETLR